MLICPVCIPLLNILVAFQDWISCTEKGKKNFQTFLEKMCNYGQKTTCRMLYTDLLDKRSNAIRFYAPKIDSLWEADLVFVQDVAKQNNSVKYLLVAIDVLSKYAWVSPMKDKTGKSLIAAFNSILKNGRKPEKLRTDKGTEFVNVSFQEGRH